jgi:hypothetical protein
MNVARAGATARAATAAVERKRKEGVMERGAPPKAT